MSDCAICLSNIDGKCKLDSCSHEFCFKCIKKWAKKNNTCPMCRAKIGKITSLGKRKRVVNVQPGRRRRRYIRGLSELFVSNVLRVVQDEFRLNGSRLSRLVIVPREQRRDTDIGNMIELMNQYPRFHTHGRLIRRSVRPGDPGTQENPISVE